MPISTPNKVYYYIKLDEQISHIASDVMKQALKDCKWHHLGV